MAKEKNIETTDVFRRNVCVVCIMSDPIAIRVIFHSEDLVLLNLPKFPIAFSYIVHP